MTLPWGLVTTPLAIPDDGTGGSNNVVGRLVTTGVGTGRLVTTGVGTEVRVVIDLHSSCMALIMPI